MPGVASLLGRDAEFVRIRHDLAGGHGVVVVGEAGVGKTVLLERALTGTNVRTGRCFRSLAGAGAAPLQHAMGRLLPVGDPAWTAQWMISHLGKAVLCVEDLQWADALTLATLELLVGRTALAVTVRTGDPGSEAALAAVDGLTRVDLEPLDAPFAEELAARLYPSRRPEELADLARRCGGNPLLIAELGCDAEPTASLRRSVVRRLRRMGSAPWTGFGLLVRAGEPLRAGWIPGLTELSAAALVVDEIGMVRPRHPLLAECVRHHLVEDADECRRVDLLLARQAESDGRSDLAAGAYAAAGDRPRALDLARAAAAAAGRPGDRAALLGLAANCADGEFAAELAVTAVSELVQIGDYAAADELIKRLPQQRSASWLSLLGRVRWQTGDDNGALQAFSDGRALVTTGSREDIVLRCEHARAIVLSGGDLASALRLVEQAHTLSIETGRERSRALAVLGTVEYFAGHGGAHAHLAEAVQIVDNDPDADLQVAFSSVNNLVGVLESAGRLDAAVEHAERGAARAETLRMRGWAQQLRAMALNAGMHAGSFGPVVAGAGDLLEQAIDRRTRDQLEVTLGLVLVDLGRASTAERRLTRALNRCADDHYGRGNLLWVASEARLWAGEPARALELAEQALALLPDQMSLFPLVTLAHAELRLGRAVTERACPEPTQRVVHAVPVELSALRAKSRGDAGAERLFTEAAELWRGRHRRGELRCRWLAADAAADSATAVARLITLEHELSADGWAPLLAMVRRSLRERGVRRSAPRGRAGGLTLREREVLGLVAEGLSTDAVAARLGLSAATVAALVASARSRLGATTRWEAVSRS